ncbi:hypothetical protein TNCV_3260291 [Trichonephila clavipes]|nr:hypothetical protein TNCV_3260291 [Trichonephila clavipes]
MESIRSDVRWTSCAEDPKKTSSNYRISIGRAEEHVRETFSAVLIAETTIPVATPVKEEKAMDDLRVVHVKVKGEQEMVNSVIDRTDMSAWGQSRCCRRTKHCQEVVIDLRPKTYTQSLSNAPNENSVVVESNASNVQTYGQGIKESKSEVALT